MHIHQILINDTGDLPMAMPDYTAMCQKSLRDIYAGADIHVWCGQEIQQLLAREFGPEVLQCYLSLIPYSYRSDLARYCILWLYGGLYVDLNTRFINAWPTDLARKPFWAFRDYHKAQRRIWSVSTSIIHCTPRNRILESCINIIMSHVQSRYMGEDPLRVTGPGVLGQAICQHPEYHSDTSGEICCLTPMHAHQTLAFVQDSGNIVALRRPGVPGDLASHGFIGTNNYRDLWQHAAIYQPPVSNIDISKSARSQNIN